MTLVLVVNATGIDKLKMIDMIYETKQSRFLRNGSLINIFGGTPTKQLEWKQISLKLGFWAQQPIKTLKSKGDYDFG